MKKLLFITIFISFSFLNVKSQNHNVKIATTCHLYYTEKEIEDFIQKEILYPIENKKYTSTLEKLNLNVKKEYILYPILNYNYKDKITSLEKDIKSKIFHQKIQSTHNIKDGYITDSINNPIGRLCCLPLTPYIYNDVFSLNRIVNISELINKYHICMIFTINNLNDLWGITKDYNIFIFSDKNRLLGGNNLNKNDTLITPERFVELYKDEIHYFDDDIDSMFDSE